MRRLTAVVFSLFLANAVLAGVHEADVTVADPGARFGRMMILHPTEALTESDRAELATRGITVRRTLTGGRYLARVREGAATNDARIASIEPLTATKKIQASALRELSRAKPVASVSILFQDDVSFEGARKAILEAGGAIDDPFRVRFSVGHRIPAKIPAAALQALAEDDRVFLIAGPPRARIRADNAVSAAVAHVTEVQAAPYNLSGEGVVVSEFELAEGQQSHVEFQGRSTVHASGGDEGDKQHATHTAGTIIAAGLNPAAKGMAPKARLHQFCLDTPSNNCVGDWPDLKDTELQPLGVVADNNSWGYVLGWSTDDDGNQVWVSSDQYYGAYSVEYGAPFIDEISIDRKVLFIHSAGNDGNMGIFSSELAEHLHVDDEGDTIPGKFFCYSPTGSGTDCPASCNGGCEATKHHTQTPYETMGVTASAKNAIAVGALNATGSSATIASFSSRGPARDGRVKPDVVARGVSVFSTIPTDTYTRMQGTSMASPVVTGIAALLTEQWRKTFAGATPLPEQMKALLIAGVTDLGNPGPDYTYGFGMVDAKKSVDLILADGGTGKRIRNLNLAQGATVEVPMTLSPAQNLRVLLNWADPPTVLLGDDALSAKALVNDLDVKVIDPSGVTHLPYVLDKVNYTANATLGVNTVDNVEMIDIANAPAGTYRVIVSGTHIAEGPQGAVLVLSADAGASAPPCRDAIESAIGSNDTPGTAFGNLVPGQELSGGLCSQNDVDYYKFVATDPGPVSVTVTAGDTPIRATLSSTGLAASVDIPANSTRTLNTTVGETPVPFTLKIEPTGPVASAGYTFITHFEENHTQPKRRAVR
jgi:hypothetical protein